jgi:hypothetical protein
VLWANGIKDGIYQPPSTQADPTDWLPMREFNVKIAGFSSLPSLNAVRGKLKDNKSFTLSEDAVAAGLFLYEASGVMNSSLEARLKWIDAKVAELTARKRQDDSRLQQQKFGLAMTGRWFAGRTRADNVVSVQVNGLPYKVTFDLREVQEPV